MSCYYPTLIQYTPPGEEAKAIRQESPSYSWFRLAWCKWSGSAFSPPYCTGFSTC